MAIEVRYMRFDVQQRRAIQNVHIMDVQDPIFDLV